MNLTKIETDALYPGRVDIRLSAGGNSHYIRIDIEKIARYLNAIEAIAIDEMMESLRKPADEPLP